MKPRKSLVLTLFLFMLLVFTDAVSAKPNYHSLRQVPKPCDRSTFSGKINCSFNESYLGVKEDIRRFSSNIKTYQKRAMREVRHYLAQIPYHRFKKLIPSSLTNTTNAPPVIYGAIRSLKYGNGVNPYVLIDLPNGFEDSDGYIRKVTWNLGDGNIIELEGEEISPTGMILHVFKNSDHYNVIVTVEDDLGATTTTSAYVETPENSEPSAVVTATAISSNNIRFDITPSDEDGSTFTFRTYACFSTPVDSNVAYCNYGAPGTYDFFTRVTDSNGTSIEIGTLVTMNGTSISALPVPIVRANTYFGAGPLTVDFDATKSFDINGQIVSYRWDFGDYSRPQNASTLSRVSHTFVKPGTYTVQLFVKDDDGNETSTYWDIFVTPSFEAEPYLVAQYAGPNTVRFDSSQSSITVPADASMLFWDFGDGEKQIGGRYPTHTYASSGTYDVKLKLIEITGETHLIEKTITIGASDDSPISSHTISAYEPYIGDGVTFDGTNSSDPGASQPLEYRWVFDDGDQIEEDEALKSFEERGIYNYELWVTNSRGLSSQSGGLIQVKDPFSQLDARMSFSPKIGYGPMTVHVDASPTIAPNPIVYQEMSTNNIFSIESTGEFTVTDPGTYYFRYYVKDSLGNESMEFGDVRVLSPGSIPPGNQSPVAQITHYQDMLNPRLYNLNCSSSSDPDDYVAYCSWKVNGKTINDNMYVSTLFSEDILYTVELTVTDSWGAQNTIYRQFDFSPGPVELITFDHSPLVPVLGNPVQFGAENSTIPGKDIKVYIWDFGDGGNAYGPIVTHTYSTAGTYSVELTIIDSDNVDHTFSKDIVISAIANSLALEVTAQDPSLSTRVSQNGTYKTFSAPDKIRFNVESTSLSPKAIQEATWDFGDGTIAYGKSVEHVFHKAGTYTVGVTAQDTVSNSASAELTVIVPNVSGCYADDGQTICLTDSDSDNLNVSSLSDVWTLEHDLDDIIYSTNPNDYQRGWAKILSENGDIYDVSQAVKAEGNVLKVFKNLLPKEISVHSPTELKIATRSTSHNPLIGTWPMHYIGTSGLTVNVNQTNVKLSLINPSAQFRKDVDVASGSSVNFEALPAGQYALIAMKDGKSIVQSINLLGSKTVSIDMNTSSKLTARNNKKQPVIKGLKSFHKSMAKQELWTQSLCGESTPFPVSRTRHIESGESRHWLFTSTTPLALSTFRDVPAGTNKNIRLSCAIKSPGLLYGQNKWKYKEGPYRCWNDSNPHFYWASYLEALKYEESPVTIKYEIRDEWSTDKVSGHLVTSAKGIMKDNGLNLEDLSARIGLPENEEQDWAQRVNYEIPVPAQFVRPQIRFELFSEHDSSPESFYSVECDVLNTNGVPRLAALEAISANNDDLSAEENGRLSLSRRYGLFPAQYDDRSSSPLSIRPDIAKAAYVARIDYKNRSDITWQAVEVEFKYGNSSHTETYDFSGSPVIDAFHRIYENQFLIDTEALEGKFNWIKGVGDISLKITPLGRVASDYDYRGTSKTYDFKALFDLQTENVTSSEICSHGFYPENISTFARDELTSLIVHANGTNSGVRCGDVSLPFGGPFTVSTEWKHSGHQVGMEASLRSFNSQAFQDDYDGDGLTSQRVTDLMAYQDYSNSLDLIAATQIEEMNGEPTDKKKILDFCNPLSGPIVLPCSESTNFDNITKSMLHEVCLMNSSDSMTPPGCPSPNLEKLTRFSRWVEANSQAFIALLKATSFEAQISTGLFSPIYPQINTNWQEKALRYGQWPDGMQIFKADNQSDIFIKTQLNECQLSSNGCSEFDKLFQFDTSKLDSMSFKTGWN